MSAPANSIVPLAAGRRPAMASISSVCPLPSTPATPRISPAATENDTLSTAFALRELATLRLTHGELGDASLRRYDESRPLDQRLHLALRSSAIEPAAASDLRAERDVLRHRQGRHEHEVLVHHADAGHDRVRGVPTG